MSVKIVLTGLPSCIYIKCTKCDYVGESYTSSLVNNTTGTHGRTTIDINIRATYAMRRCAVGLPGMQKILWPSQYANTYK